MLHQKLTRIAFIFVFSFAAAAGADSVKVWEEQVTIPTYKLGPNNLNPIFYSGRTYQGAKGPVYPYPLMDNLTDNKVDQTYDAVYLENEFVKISVLPQIGGRIFTAVDKTNGYDYIYRQHVIKPALIGMIGAWISGGIEWDIPHHHRASSFLPVDYRITQNKDGSKTVWVGETEWRHRMKWVIGITLRPGKSYLEVTVKLFNRTPLAHSFLYFANVAVHTNDNYQIIFPPRTQFVTHHSKVQFARWPIADNIYGGADFRGGVDVSWWKNHPKPNSMFAWNFWDDFLAGYDHGRKAGVLHVADHNVVPGKKFFTWGRDDRAKMWGQMLTDTDGPYLELMVGGWSDNQPDYSWAQPHEVKQLTQYWYPFRDIGGVKNANREAAVNLEVNGDKAKFGFNTTSEHSAAKVLLRAGGRTLFETEIAIGPDKPFAKEVTLPAGTKPEDVTVSLSTDGKELIEYTPLVLKKEPMPEPVKPPPPPKKIKTNEELYLTGLRLEQFYNPAREPYPYYEEALRRDPGDYRVNTELGLLYLQRGIWPKAEKHLRAAVKRITRNYTRPKDGEALYYLGVALQAQNKSVAAIDAFNRAAWSYAWSAASHYALAEIASSGGDYSAALRETTHALDTNRDDPRALGLRAVFLRKLGRLKGARWTAARVRKIDPLNHLAANELYLLATEAGKDEAAGKILTALRKQMRDDPQNYLELASVYARASLWKEAADVADRGIRTYADQSKVHPMLYYFRGYYATRMGRRDEALQYYKLAAAASPDYCFPFRMEAVAALEDAMKLNPSDARAPYYLGNLYFDNQPEKSLVAWEKSRALDPNFSLVHRNLGLAYARVRHDYKAAIASLEKSIALREDARVLFELDQVYEAAGVPAKKRLAMLTAHQAVAEQRDDTMSREIPLLVEVGDYDRALALLAKRHYHKWEGLASLHGAYVDAHILRGNRSFDAGKYKDALKDYEAALLYPKNLESAKGYRDGSLARPYYYVGRARKALGETAAADEAFHKSIADADDAFLSAKPGLSGMASILYYKGLSLRELGKVDEAEKVFARMQEAGEQTLAGRATVNYYAKFGAAASAEKRKALAHYVIGLSYLGRNKKAEARQHFEEALKLNPGLLEANRRLQQLR